MVFVRNGGTVLGDIAGGQAQNGRAIGNVVGSNIFNILAILGAAPLLQPLQGDRISPVDLGVMLFCAVILYPMMRTGNTISRKEGAFLLFVYVAYTTWLIVA